MSRLAILLTALGTVLIAVLWWFLLWSPTSDEIDEVRARTETTLEQAQLERLRAAELRAVRDTAPESEAELSAVQVLIPRDGALPALLRQLQQAADDAGVRLSSVSPSRPSPVDAAAGPLNLTQVSMSVSGSYFQLVDLARRLEDPEITGRGFVWRSVTVSRGAYPELSASLTAVVYSQGVEDAPAPEPESPEADADDGDDADSDLDDDTTPELEDGDALAEVS